MAPLPQELVEANSNLSKFALMGGMNKEAHNPFLSFKDICWHYTNKRLPFMLKADLVLNSQPVLRKRGIKLIIIIILCRFVH